MAWRKPISCLILLVAITTIGCGGQSQGPPKLKTVPVTGVVTYQGKPVADASISLQHLEGKATSLGKSDASGRFTLSTYGNQDGAPAGKYKVVVAVSTVKEIEPGVLAPEPPGGFKSPIPVRYANPATTDIVVEVNEAGKNELTIALK